MDIYLLPVGMLQTNCYIIVTERKNAIVIDAGANPEGILAFLQREGATAKLLVFTHGHYDHIGAATALKDATGAMTVVPKEDEELFLNPAKTGSGFFTSYEGYRPEPADRLYCDGEEIALDEVRLKAMHTPGHTKGSSILIGDEVIFTGDTLFAGSCGRTDLYGGSETELSESLHKIAALVVDCRILPGHGESTLLSTEKMTNPFLGTNYDDIF